MGNCGSEDAVEVANLNNPSKSPIEPTATVNNKALSRPTSPLANNKYIEIRPQTPKERTASAGLNKSVHENSTQSPQAPPVYTSNTNLKNENNHNENTDSTTERKSSANSQKAPSRVASAQPLWLAQPTIPADTNIHEVQA